jgi:hypothetical protein
MLLVWEGDEVLFSPRKDFDVRIFEEGNEDVGLEGVVLGGAYEAGFDVPEESGWGVIGPVYLAGRVFFEDPAIEEGMLADGVYEVSPCLGVFENRDDGGAEECVDGGGEIFEGIDVDVLFGDFVWG